MLASEATYLKGLLQWRTAQLVQGKNTRHLTEKYCLSAYLPLRDGRFCLDFLKSGGGGAGDMAQQVKALDTKSDDLS